MFEVNELRKGAKVGKVSYFVINNSSITFRLSLVNNSYVTIAFPCRRLCSPTDQIRALWTLVLEAHTKEESSEKPVIRETLETWSFSRISVTMLRAFSWCGYECEARAMHASQVIVLKFTQTKAGVPRLKKRSAKTISRVPQEANALGSWQHRRILVWRRFRETVLKNEILSLHWLKCTQKAG